MKKYLLLIVSLVYGLISFGQSWKLSHVLPAGTYISDLEANGKMALIATNKGVYRTDDTGNTWVNTSLEQVADISCYYDTCYACGYAGLVIKSLDGGKTWVKKIVTQKSLFQIRALKNYRAAVFSSYKSYSYLDHNFFSTDSMYLNANGSGNWFKVAGIKPSQSDFCISYIQDFFMVFNDIGVGAVRDLVYTKTWGSTYIRPNWEVYTDYIPLQIDMLDDKTGFALFLHPGDGFTILKTSDYANNFKIITNSSNSMAAGLFANPSCFDFVDSMTGWVTGAFGNNNGIYKTNNGGQNWSEDTAGFNATGMTTKHLQLRMVSPTFGWGFYSDKVIRYGNLTSDSNVIKGRVYLDKNKNCIYDIGIDIPLKNKILKISENNFYATTDSNGQYIINLIDKGQYNLTSELFTNQFISLACGTSATIPITFSSIKQTVVADFPVDASYFIKPVVTLETSLKRRCFKGETKINYLNESFFVAKNVKVVYKVPEFSVLISADKSYTLDSHGNYVFNIGTLEELESGSITIIDSVICGDESIRGLTTCSEAFIYADSVNYKTDTVSWDKSEIIVKAFCMNGWINFKIINTTAFSMSDSAEVRFFSDAKLKNKRKYKLGAGDTLNYTIKADYATWRVEADQRPGHPISKFAQATLEGCKDNDNGSGKVSTGYVNKLPVNDFLYKKSVSCEPILDSYDPNDKTVYPSGITSNNYVKPGTPLKYRIRFQNTGSAPAIKIVVKDTLSTDFDLGSFVFTGASHNYTYKITGNGVAVLEVTFDNINLPDSSSDKAGSNGFFVYTVKHKKNIDEGTRIDNKAYIYFDYNSPIITNTASILIKDTVLTDFAPIILQTKLPFIVKGYAKDTLCKGDTARLIIIGEGPYNWKEQNNPTSIGSSYELQVVVDTTTEFIGQTADGIENFTVFVKACKGGPNATHDINIECVNIYPNPSTDGIFYISDARNIESIQIIDITGRKAGAVNANTINLAGQAPGVYFVIATTITGDTFYKKLIKK